MKRKPPYDPAAVCAELARAIALKTSQDKLAAACGVTQAAISRVRMCGRISPHLAIAVHRATDGAVPGSALRPDLWRRPEHVPVAAPATSVEPQGSADACGAPVDRRRHLLDGVGQRADRGEQGDDGAAFRLPERSDCVFIEIMPGLSANCSVDEKVRIVGLLISVVGAPDPARGGPAT